MSYAEVCGAVEALQKKYHESNPFRLCEDMNILLLSQALGNVSDFQQGGCHIPFVGADTNDHGQL